MANLLHLTGQALRSEEKRLRENAYRARWKRARRARDPEKVRAEARDYRARNVEKRREWERKWRNANPEKSREAGRRYHYRNYLKQMICQARNRSNNSGLTFDLTQEWAQSRWTGACELTGLEFSHPSKGRSQFSASIDRIDNSLGYTKDNCRFILWAINKLKGEDTDEVMMLIARALIAKRSN